MFDIVIPVHSKDFERFLYQIEYTKKNIIGYRNIYIVTNNTETPIKNCILINENIFPFNIKLIIEKYNINSNRAGWYLQQLIKLYSSFIIPNILDNYLVIDSDTFFMKPTTFIENDKLLFNIGVEYHIPYFTHMKKLHNSLNRNYNDKSGITHHMIFNKQTLINLFNLVCGNNDIDNNIMKFYDIFLKNIVNSEKSGASEYEIYFNYMIKYHYDKIKIRKLKWLNYKKNMSINYFKTNHEYDYISYHQYEIDNIRLKNMIK